MRDRVLRLLIVDDQENWRYALRMQFSGRVDVSVADAVGPDDALRKVGAADYDLVLLDMRMPSGTEGLDVLSEIKKLKPHSQVIVMSAYGDITKAVEAMKRGALDFLPKGSDFDDIVKYKVDEFIRTAHLAADRELLIREKYREAARARSAQKKGQALEVLLAALVASVEGFTEIARNCHTETEEIDIVFRNGSRDPAWHRESEIVLVECKNWKSQRVGKNELVAFERKIENRYDRCKLGFLVCTEEFAETVGQERLRASRGAALVVPIDGDDLRQLVESKSRSKLLRSFVDRAILT